MYKEKEKRKFWFIRAEIVLEEQNSVMLNFSGPWRGSCLEPDEENVDVEGGEDGDGEGQEQGEDKGDPSVPVQPFAQAVLQSFWGGRGEVAEKNDFGGTFGASLLLNRAKAMLYFSIQAWLEFRMMSWTFMKCEHLPKNWIEDRMRGRTKEKLRLIQ